MNRSLISAILFLLPICFVPCESAPQSAWQTETQTTVRQQAPTTTATISSSTSAIVQTKAKQEKPKPSKKLRIFLETRNVIARPEGYETLLTIEEDGAMTFQWHTVSGRSNTITAQLKPEELKALNKVFNEEKFFAAQPATNVMYADWIQYLTVEKNEKAKNFRMMVDYKKRTKQAIDEAIKTHLGAAMVNETWAFIAVVRTINDRFRF
jgi:hypothetical protein